jgi:hypothetical protein
LGVAFLAKRINAHASAKAIIHAELVTATGKYLLSKITYQYNSELMLDAKTKEIECENIVDVLQRLSKAVAHKIENGYTFDSSALDAMSEEDEAWGNFELGAGSHDPELDNEVQTSNITMSTLLQRPRAARKATTIRGTSLRRVANKLRIKRSVEPRMAMSSVRAV